MKTALTIAGSDSGGGAGIQADLKTFSALGIYGTSVITAVTAQNTLGVTAVQDIMPEIVQKQLEAVLSDIGADAIKIGMVSNSECITVISDSLKLFKGRNIVVDPVLLSTTGFSLIKDGALGVLLEKLVPLASVLTPNLPEAEMMTGMSIKNIDEMRGAAVKLFKMGAKAVLVKGGHLEGPATDILYDGDVYIQLEAERIDTTNTHGTGCTLSSAVAAYLAKGLSIADAVGKAKDYVTMALKHAYKVGHGSGPTHHFYAIWPN